MSLDHFEPKDTRTPRGFYLVQRVKRSHRAELPPDAPLAKLGRNPFGYGTLGNYDLDYMGSAEFEFGAIPAAYNRLVAAKKDLMLATGEHEFKGRKLDFLYVGKEGDPWDAFLTWAEGRPFTDSWGSQRTDAPFYGKERPYDFERLLTEPDYEYGGHVWWALAANVQWAFHDGEDGHLLQMLASMDGAPAPVLRG